MESERVFFWLYFVLILWLLLLIFGYAFFLFFVVRAICPVLLHKNAGEIIINE